MILATSKVEDFDRWMKIFSTTKGVEKRKHGGSKGSTVFQAMRLLEAGHARGKIVITV